ncbi:hypothetical protein LCGC14_1134370 [marine sediment metagenome]|uniref:Uncharacterized protein n=1 Tax=marine sediment metagenome TaxID=412755 RepID=A0A0F9Q611_9ZZZZ
MRRKNFLKLSILAVLVISIAGGVSAYHEYVYTFDETHTSGCHNNGNDGESAGGSLHVTATPSGNLEPYQAFEITVDILNFTELDASTYENRTTIGISKDMGDNAAFFRGVSNKSFSRRIKVDENGDKAGTTFGVVAPATPGNYDLVVVAIAAMNQSTASGYNFTFAQGTLAITVVAPSTGGASATISGGIFGITFGIVVGISTLVLLQMRKRIRKKDI